MNYREGFTTLEAIVVIVLLIVMVVLALSIKYL